MNVIFFPDPPTLLVSTTSIKYLGKNIVSVVAELPSNELSVKPVSYSFTLDIIQSKDNEAPYFVLYDDPLVASYDSLMDIKYNLPAMADNQDDHIRASVVISTEES